MSILERDLTASKAPLWLMEKMYCLDVATLDKAALKTAKSHSNADIRLLPREFEIFVTRAPLLSKNSLIF